MLHDRIVDNNEIGRKIWKICTAFGDDLHSVERFILCWMICTTVNDLYYVEWYTLRWMICTAALNYLYSVESSVQRWMICTTLNDLHNIEWFLLRWKICTTLNNSESEWWCRTLNHLDYDELLSIGFLMSAGCAYLRKYCTIFYTNLWVYFFLICKYQEKIYSALPQKLVIKRCFWSL